MNRQSRTLASAFDPHANSLNAIRLVLAAAVIVWHSLSLTGRAPASGFGVALLSDLPVDGFFVISGFLLSGSLLARPALWGYLRKRFLRIMPAFWAALLLVALLFAPVARAVSGGNVAALFAGPHSAWRYLLSNSYLWMHFYDVAGTPKGVPEAGVWNGSLWTLRWEALAYLALAALSLGRVLQRRRMVLLLWVLTWFLALAVAMHLTPTAYGYYQTTFARLGLMFLTGVALQRFADVIPSRAWLAGACAGLVVAGCVFPDYRLIAAAPLAYLLVWTGSAVQHPALRLNDRDISYGVYIYGMPVQQALLLLGAAALPTALFAGASLVATLPFAIASWVFVERPAMRLRGRRLALGSGARSVAAPAGTALPGSKPVEGAAR